MFMGKRITWVTTLCHIAQEKDAPAWPALQSCSVGESSNPEFMAVTVWTTPRKVPITENSENVRLRNEMFGLAVADFLQAGDLLFVYIGPGADGTVT